MPIEPAEPGIRRCQKCQWLFVSPDRVRVRRCADCKTGDDAYMPRTADTAKIESAARCHRDTS